MKKNAESGRHFEILAAAVAAGSTTRAAAASCGCSERVAYRLAGMPEFQRRVSALRSAMVDSSVGRISGATSKAVDKLVALLDDPHSALGAAKAILANVAPLSELGELRGRLDALESER